MAVYIKKQQWDAAVAAVMLAARACVDGEGKKVWTTLPRLPPSAERVGTADCDVNPLAASVDMESIERALANAISTLIGVPVATPMAVVDVTRLV